MNSKLKWEYVNQSLQWGTDVCTDRKSQLQQKPTDVSDNKTDVVLYRYTHGFVLHSLGGRRETGDGFVSGEGDPRACFFSLLRHMLD